MAGCALQAVLPPDGNSAGVPEPETKAPPSAPAKARTSIILNNFTDEMWFVDFQPSAVRIAYTHLDGKLATLAGTLDLTGGYRFPVSVKDVIEFRLPESGSTVTFTLEGDDDGRRSSEARLSSEGLAFVPVPPGPALGRTCDLAEVLKTTALAGTYNLGR
jgi:hypothetical protein